MSPFPKRTDKQHTCYTTSQTDNTTTMCPFFPSIFSLLFIHLFMHFFSFIFSFLVLILLIFVRFGSDGVGLPSPVPLYDLTFVQYPAASANPGLTRSPTGISLERLP